jgi:outer membrane receptor protein involved in Fe transport
LKFILLISAFVFAINIFPQNTGNVTGRITDSETKEPLPFINILIKGTQTGSASDEKGFYSLQNIPAGEQTLILSGVGYRRLETVVNITPGQTLKRDFVLSASAVEVSEVLVYGASLRKEKITEAPSAITVIGNEEIRRNAAHIQIPKLLENKPGVDIVQNGLFDFNVNTRGFNSSLNRRLLILLDGRDLGTAFLGATEWNGLSSPLEDLERIELVRGPGSALYGANAYNGVLSITSLSPKAAPGTRFAFGAGEKNTYRADVKFSNVLKNFSYRLNVGGFQGNSFSRSRLSPADFEYPLDPIFNLDVVPLDLSPIKTVFSSGRFDYEFSPSTIATVEGGYALVENEVIVTGIGRVQIRKAARPWGRINLHSSGLNLLAWTNSRINIEPEVSLSTGLDLVQDAQITHVEAQYAFQVIEDKLFAVTGASHRFINIDTQGTLMAEERNDNLSGVFAQLEYRFTNNLKALVAARFDRSSLHENQISPKAAIVYSPFQNHTFRVSFNKAFQPPNYSEQYLHVLHPVRAIAYFGNPDLVPESILGYEIGYKGIIDNSLFVTADVYLNELEQFITDLAPGVNPKYPTSIFINNMQRTVWSYGNAGRVIEGGIELGVNYFITDYLLLDLTGTYFKFEVLDSHAADVLLPNTPEYKFNIGTTYFHPKGHTAEITFKHVPTYPWAAGIFKDGNIESYNLVNIAGTYKYSNLMSFNLNVANLFDSRHYEILGGSMLGRRAIVTAILSF